MNREQQLEEIENILGEPTPKYRQCLLKNPLIPDNIEYCIYCGEEHTPVFSERQLNQVASIAGTMAAFTGNKAKDDLQWQIDLLGRELYYVNWRLIRVIQLLRDTIEQMEGHFKNLDGRVYKLEEKYPKKKRASYD